MVVFTLCLIEQILARVSQGTSCFVRKTKSNYNKDVSKITERIFEGVVYIFGFLPIVFSMLVHLGCRGNVEVSPYNDCLLGGVGSAISGSIDFFLLAITLGVYGIFGPVLLFAFFVLLIVFAVIAFIFKWNRYREEKVKKYWLLLSPLGIIFLIVLYFIYQSIIYSLVS